jgi:serine/threonine-protein kinase
MLGDRYRIVSLLGRGGMGEVYRAEDLSLGQQVALKFLPPSLTRDEEALRRLRDEVRIARQVSHANVCRVYDIGELDGALFLSMEYVDGEDLASLLRRIGRLPVTKGLEIARKLCAGLAAAHDKGILHRDLKPGNIMLDSRGHVLLTDFGLAALSTTHEVADIRSGTPAYMAPEQLAGKEVTVRSDIYALGLVLYEIFTGDRPHAGAASLPDLVRMRNESAPDDPSSYVQELDPTIGAVIQRCLEPDPRSRPASALAVAAALPGGDPLAAALAAGETPSPQMIAAAGGEGVSASSIRAQSLLLAGVLAGVVITAAMAVRTSALERIAPDLPPQVLVQKAREIAASVNFAGASHRPTEYATGLDWYFPFVGTAATNRNRTWNQILNGTPSFLRFWYRQSEAPMTGGEYHSDLLTPGIVTQTDPPPTQSGMTEVVLDARGRLIRFETIPPQVLQDAKAQPLNWDPLFRSADLDAATLKPADPQWTWLAASEVRAAWTGVWPGTTYPLRVEAAALAGRTVAFALLGPWDKPSRVPPPDTARSDWQAAIYGILAVVICVVSALFARQNLETGRGDRRGAFRLAMFFFLSHFVLWAATAPSTPTTCSDSFCLRFAPPSSTRS